MLVRLRALAFAVVSLAAAFGAHAGVVYHEEISGDLSGDGLAPTSVELAVGSNEIYGSTGRTVEAGTDRDYFAISVPTGHEIIALIEKAGTTTVGGVAFLAVQTGSQVTVPVTPDDATGLLGWIHYFGATEDRDILADLGSNGFGATDFVPPLPAGDYAFWVQDTGLGSASYGFDFVIAPVPEPSAAAALLLGLLAFGLARGLPKRGVGRQMLSRRLAAIALFAATVAGAASARAGIVYDEAVSGDFSGDGLAPTSVVLEPGSNQIFGVTGRVVLDPDRDYFTVTIPDGYRFVALIELAGTSINSQVSFLGIQGGPQVTVETFAGDATGLLGWTHYHGTDVDIDILPAVGAGGDGATGFVPPLPAGAYSFWIQDFGDGDADYGLDIVVALPEPGVSVALLLACTALAAARAGRARG
ncbi:MAG: hypothetical protein WEF50_06695 [Myxococcota bacterium]